MDRPKHPRFTHRHRRMGRSILRAAMKHRIAVFGLILVAIGAALMFGHQWSSMREPDALAEQPVAQEVVSPPAKPVEPVAIEAATPGATAATTPEAGGTFRGRVIDAVTRQPISKFEITLVGVPQGHIIGDEPQVAKTFESTDGRFA